jgi:hypothetical protein
MSVPGPQHELAVTLINVYPGIVYRLAALCGMRLPVHDRVEASPVSHQVRGKSRISNDVTVRLYQGDQVVCFVQIEMQRGYSWDKFATLRAYHGSEVRNSGCGGHMIVLSPEQDVAASYARAEERHGDKLSYSGGYLGSGDLGPLAAAERPFEERALAAAVADMSKGIPAGAGEMLAEMYRHSETLGGLYLDAILEERKPDDPVLEEVLSPDLMERIKEIPAFRARFDQARDEGWAKGEAEGRARGEARGEGESLLRFFRVRGDDLAPHVLDRIRACTDPALLADWQERAYRGETSGQIFGAS